MNKTGLTLLSALCILSCSASESFGWGVGTTRMNFLKINPSARSAGMGGASAAVVQDVYAVNTNPACLVNVKAKEISLTRLQWVEGITYNWFGYAANTSERSSSLHDSDEFETVMVDNFNDGQDPNMLNGAIGTWDDSGEEGTSFAQAAYYNGSRENMYDSSGYSYEVVYDVKPRADRSPGNAGVWIALNNLNANKYMFVSFMMKGASGNESFKIGLKDVKGGEIKVNLSKYSKPGTEWARVDIPLEEFRGVDTANLENISFTFSGAGKVYFDDIKLRGTKAPKKAFAISFGHLDSGTMEGYAETDIAPYYERKEDFSAQETMIVLSFAREFLISSLNVPMGMNIKTIREKLHPSVAPSWAFAFDLGGMHNFATVWGNVVMGLTFQNLGYATPPQDVTDPLPINVKTSIAAFPRDYNIAFDMDIDAPIDNKFKLSLGFEGWIADTFACRVGYAFGQDLGGFGAGFGFKAGKVNVDYALAPYSLFGNTHRLSLSYKFGKI